MFHNFRRWLRRHINTNFAPARRRKPGLHLEQLENRLTPTVHGFSTISNWVGTGSNQAALVVDFHNGQAGDSVVFGYRWDGTASGEDMLKALSALPDNAGPEAFLAQLRHLTTHDHSAD